MKAIILAGGLGTRLHPLTVNLPKPMVPVGNQPMMEYIIYLLRKYKLKDITALLYHKPEIIKGYFGDGENFGVKISYVEAKEDFGTAGAVKFAAGNRKDALLVISADLITDFNLQDAISFHKAKKSMATLVLTRVATPLQYGIVMLNKDGRIKHFLEKPSWSEVFSDTVNCGIYILEPEIFKYIETGRPFDFSQDLFPLLLSESVPMYGYVAEGIWKDIGSLVEYQRVNSAIFKGENFVLSDGAKIDAKAHISGLGIIGENSTVEAGACVENTSIGRNCHIGKGAIINQCILWDNVAVGEESRIEKSVIARGTVIGSRCFIEEGVVIGEECNIGKDVNIKPYVKIWPKKVIEEGATVSRSIVWRERWSRGIFGPYGVTGICNVELTPEFAAALGSAYGTVMEKGTYISTSHDSHPASRMIYRSLLSGALSSGVNVSDLGMVPIPVNRFELKALKSCGGFHVRKSPYDPQVIDIKFFDENGMDLASAREKKIERLFFGEDFKRVGINEVGEISFPYHRVAESYRSGLISGVNANLIASSGYKIVIDYAHSSASQIFPSILGALGLDVIAVNAHIDEARITKTRSMFEKSLSQFSQIVKSLDADLGIMLDTGAEKIFLCDEKGEIFQGDIELAIVFTLHCMANKNSFAAVSIKASRTIEEIAKKYGVNVLRTKTSVRNMMERCQDPKIQFFGETAGGFIFPKFQCSFDAMFSSIKTLEMLSVQKAKLSEIAAQIPKISMASKDISCSSEKKGKVLRAIVDDLRDERFDLTDGVKVFEGKDWVLILPDPVRPLIHIYSEADNNRSCLGLIKKYVDKIDSIL